MVKSYKIFISHGSGDSWIARQMGKRIQDDCGALTFLDVEQIASGDNFKDGIHIEIREASELVALIIVLLTDGAAEKSVGNVRDRCSSWIGEANIAGPDG